MSRRRQAGFSLIEILVVALLLSIFAGLAAISISTVWRENQMKAVVAELHNYREAAAFAQQDLSIIPKLNFLQQPMIGIIDPNTGFGSIPPAATSDFHIYGYDLGLARREIIATRWGGPYIAGGRPLNTNRATAIGKSGYARMLIQSQVLTPANPDDARVVSWPVDLWGQPYVVYAMKVDMDLFRPAFIQTAYEVADYTVDFVSYGPDNLPGGYINPLSKTTAETTRKEAQRLYAVAPVGSGREFDWPTETEFQTPNDEVFVQGYSEQQFGSTAYIGSIDAGSDDLHIKLQ